MGVVLSALAIKTDIDKFDADLFVKAVFTPTATRVNSYVDIRLKDQLAIAKTSDGFIWIESSLVADGILHEGDVGYLQKISDYFGEPELMIAVNEYDSGGTYGYGLIKGGQIARRRVTLSYETTIEEGPFLPIEKDWLEGEAVIGEYDEDEDKFVLYEGEVSEEDLEDDDYLRRCRINKSTGELLPENALTQHLYKQFMLTYFGYSGDDKYDYQVEYISYHL
jgi:hypothetical protein